MTHEGEIIKVGDRVVVNHLVGRDEEYGVREGDVFTVTRTEGDDESKIFGHPIREKRGGYITKSQVSLAKKGKYGKPAEPKFILQYELDRDPFELICTKKELSSRIAQLALNPQLKRDSIRVYEIKKIFAVTLGVKITMK